jgi:glycosyltransferase involved in cell wall biosynthesis
VKVVMLVGRSTGGIGTHAVDLAQGLRALGDDVSFVTDPLTADRFAVPDALPWWPGRDGGPVGFLDHLRRLRRLVRDADVVHAHGHQAGLVATVVAAGTHTPVVVSQHNAVLVGGPRRRLLGLVQRMVARRADLVTGASSDLVAESIRLGARDARLAAVPSPRVPGLLAQEVLGIEARHALAGELLRDKGIDAELGTPLVLTIARIAPQKDLETLVEAAAASISFHLGETPAPRAVWVVVGDGDADLLSRLRERVQAGTSAVHFVGPQDEPDRWLRAAEVFVLTSHWEARALVVQEAMAAGVPVVATDTGGLRDLVAGVGSLVSVGDPSAVAAAVERYVSDPAARHTASVAGRERATSWDDGKATASRWHEWYSALPGMT